MPEHFTHSTMEAKFWCSTCHKPTMHYVASGRRGGCQECIAKRAAEAEERKVAEAAAPKQESLF